MSVKFSNNATTELASSIGTSDTSITVVDGSKFPILTAGDHTYVTLDTDTASPTREIVRVTAISGNVLTVTRGQDGTSPASFAAGTKVELRLTAALLNDVAGANPSGEPIGFPDKSQTTITFDSGIRTFSITPTGASFDVYCKGVKYTYTTVQLVTIPNTTGLHFIYFSALGVLSTQMSYFTWAEHAPTAYVYWNATTQQAVYFGDERHGITLDWQTHEYLHRTRGAAIANGFLASGYTLNSSATDAATQIAIESGTFFDEDMKIDVVSTATPTAGTHQQNLLFPAKIPVLHLQGTSWVMDAPTDFPFKQGTVRPQYNSLSGGVWSTTDVGNNQHATTWILATNNLTYPVIAIIGQSATDNQGEAEAFSFADLTLPGFPSVEFRPLYKLVYKASNGYANSVNAQLVSIVDLRSISAVGAAANPATDHGNLSGLSDDDHPQYVHTSEVRTPSAAVKNSFFPSQVGQTGKYLSTDGTNTVWEPAPSGSLSFTGDVTGSGSTGSSVAMTLAASGVVAGQYTKVTVDAKGRVTAGTGVTSADVTSALGYTPYNATNPAGYTTNVGTVTSVSGTGTVSGLTLTGSVTSSGSLTLGGTLSLTSGQVTTALGFTPYNATNPSGYITGNQTITVSGDASGSGATSIALTLANSGVAAGTYTKVTVDAKGRVTTGASLASGDLPTYTGTITSGQVTTALGFTPYNATNPSGYITSSALSSYLPLSGGTLTGNVSFSQGANINFGTSTNEAGPWTISVIGSGGATPATKGTGRGRNLIIKAGDSDNGAGLAGGDMFVRGGSPVSPSVVYGDVRIADLGGQVYLRSGEIAIGSANYNSYSPTLTGTGASGTWGIRITGFANQGTARLYSTDAAYNYDSGAPYYGYLTYDGSRWLFQVSPGTPAAVRVAYADTAGSATAATSAIRLTFNDGPRDLSDRFPNSFARTVNFDFVGAGAGNGTGNYAGVMTFSPWTGTTASTGDSSYQLSFANNSGLNASGQPRLSIRNGIDTTWNAWYTLLHSGNYGSYALPLSGGTMSGNLQLGSQTNRYLSWYTNTNWFYYLAGEGNNLRLYDSDGTSFLQTSYGSGGATKWVELLGSALRVNNNGTVTSGGKFLADAWVHSDRDFANGTLIQTDINYAVSSGDPFILEIRGNSYGDAVPYDIQYQGYIYSDTIINHGGYSNGTNISGLVAINYNGNLCFWFPRQSYWNGFYVRVYVPYATYPRNRVSSVSNSAQPTTAKQVALSANIRQSLHSGNYTSYSPSLTGSGASGTWSINITGSAGSASNSTTVGGLAPAKFFNNMGNNHSTYQDFNNVPDFGAYYVQQGGNSPTGVGSHQWYGFTLGLGNDYAYSSYASQLYWPRRAQNSDTYIYVRDREGGGWSSWSKIKAGYADNSGQLNGYSSAENGASVVLRTASSGYLYLNNWIHVASSGMFSSVNGAHLLPSDSTFGAWRISGSKNGYTGISTAGSSHRINWMVDLNGNLQGWYNESYGWQMYWSGGSLTVFKNSYGGGAAATVLDSANYTSYAPSLTGSGASGSWSITAARATRANGNFYIDDNYGNGIVGAYISTRYQGVFFMGDSYKMSADGTSLANMYGIGWSHPNAGGAAGNLTDHGMLIINNGSFRCAISNSIVASGNITAYSDERLKKNWRDMPDNFVERLSQVRVGRYERIDDGMQQVGVSAQSLQPLLPEAIQVSNDEIKTLSVSYGNAALAAAVELAKELVMLKRELAEIKSRLH